MHFLPEADHIVALNQDGRIVEQGNFASLRALGGYIESLEISQTQAHKDDDESTTASESDEEAPKTQTEAEAAAAELEVATDRSIFKYYLASIGSLSLAVMIFYNIAQGFFATFRRKICADLVYGRRIDRVPRCLAELVG